MMTITRDADGDFILTSVQVIHKALIKQWVEALGQMGAIREVRRNTGCGLKDARDVIYQLEEAE